MSLEYERDLLELERHPTSHAAFKMNMICLLMLFSTICTYSLFSYLILLKIVYHLSIFRSKIVDQAREARTSKLLTLLLSIIVYVTRDSAQYYVDREQQ